MAILFSSSFTAYLIMPCRDSRDAPYPAAFPFSSLFFFPLMTLPPLQPSINQTDIVLKVLTLAAVVEMLLRFFAISKLTHWPLRIVFGSLL
jgi:hypothetical protein